LITNMTPAAHGAPPGLCVGTSQRDGFDLADEGVFVLFEELHRLQGLVGESGEAEDVAFG